MLERFKVPQGIRCSIHRLNVHASAYLCIAGQKQTFAVMFCRADHDSRSTGRKKDANAHGRQTPMVTEPRCGTQLNVRGHSRAFVISSPSAHRGEAMKIRTPGRHVRARAGYACSSGYRVGSTVSRTRSSPRSPIAPRRTPERSQSARPGVSRGLFMPDLGLTGGDLDIVATEVTRESSGGSSLTPRRLNKEQRPDRSWKQLSPEACGARECESRRRA